MRTVIRSLALAGLAALAPSALALEGPWFEDFDEAAAAAKKESKHLLVDFTGSDWCGWCIKLDKEVFDHEEFLKQAQEQYVLVKLDFPRGKAVKETVPNPQRNQELSERYDVKGFPTILLMTPEGDVFGQTGYQPGGPEKYLAHMADLRSKGLPALQRAMELAAQFEAADESAKAALLGKVLTALEDMERDQPGASRLAAAAKHALAVDPEDAQGLKTRAVTAILAIGAADGEVLDAARSLDPRNEKGLFEQAVQAQMMSVASREDVQAVIELIDVLDQTGPLKQDRIAFWVYANAANWNDSLFQKPERARYYANKALEVGSDDKRFVQRLEEIVGS